MLHSFKEHYLAEKATESLVVTFGRFNPPTNGHEVLLNKVAKVASGLTYRIYASQSNDPKKNPLSYKDKIKFMRKMFPKHARSIIMDKKARTLFDILNIAYADGFKKIVVVVGSDRVKEFDKMLNKYNGVKGRHGMYDFEDGVNVVSAGERDPDADDVSGMSASKLRAAAVDNDLIKFTNGLPSNFRDAEDLMIAVRKGMGLKESTDFRKEVKFKRTTMLREKYIEGNLFEVGDKVVIAETRESAVVVNLGPNFVTVTVDNEDRNVWISDICKE
jgi:phosphopantetheine adenylyltransferase